MRSGQQSQPLKLINECTIGIKATYNGEFANKVIDEKKIRSRKMRTNLASRIQYQT